MTVLACADIFVAMRTVLPLILYAALAAACERPDEASAPDELPPPPRPVEFDSPGATKPSAAGHFLVKLDALAAPIPLRRIHKWRVTVFDANGDPAAAARIALTGGMPAHDHGFPTAPLIDGPVQPGVFLVDGVKFNMTGWWQFRFDIRDAAITDTVDFDFLIEE